MNVGDIQISLWWVLGVGGFALTVISGGAGLLAGYIFGKISRK